MDIENLFSPFGLDINFENTIENKDELSELAAIEKESNTINELKDKEENSKYVNEIMTPVFLLNFPLSLSIDYKNNVFMSEKDVLNKDRAYSQFMSLYSFIASNAIVYLLPSTYPFQDLPYVANIGMVLPHIKERNIFVASNYTSPPRIGEETIAIRMFEMMRYNVYRSPFKWEGEAELKWIGDKNYIGGYGIRSQYEAFDWFASTFDMNIIKVRMKDKYHYHLDCLVFPVDAQNTMIMTFLLEPEEIKQIEKYTNIIDVPSKFYTMTATNNVRLYDYILSLDPMTIIDHRNNDEYTKAKELVAFLESVAHKLNMEVVFFNLSEFGKSGAALSCLVMNVNWRSYDIKV